MRPKRAAQALQPDQDSKQQCEVAGEGQPVAVQDLHACVGGADHIEIGDAAAQDGVRVHVNSSRVPSPPDRVRSPTAEVPLGRGIGRLEGQALRRRDDRRGVRPAPLRLCGCGIGRCFCAAPTARRSPCRCRCGETPAACCATGRAIRHRLQDQQASPIPSSEPRQRLRRSARWPQHRQRW
jgi:hypothetical protein